MKTRIHNLIILDESGSMENIKRAAIKALVDSLKEKGWVFAYIGANQDVQPNC